MNKSDKHRLETVSPLHTYLFEKLCKELDNGCILWTGEITKNGLGLFQIGDRKHYAIRVAWIIAKGPVPHGMQITPTCESASCVNPEHLTMSRLERVFNSRKKAFVPFVSLETRQILSNARIADLREEAHEKRLRREAKQRVKSKNRDSSDFSSVESVPYPTVNIVKRR